MDRQFTLTHHITMPEPIPYPLTLEEAYTLYTRAIFRLSEYRAHRAEIHEVAPEKFHVIAINLAYTEPSSDDIEDCILTCMKAFFIDESVMMVQEVPYPIHFYTPEKIWIK